MEIPTFKIKLPLSEKEIEMKKWITAEDYEWTMEPMYQAARITMKTDKHGNPTPDAMEMKEGKQSENERRTISAYVAEIDGKKEKEEILEIVNQLPAPDYRMIKGIASELGNEYKKKVNQAMREIKK